MKPLLSLDLEEALLDNAVSQPPRPALYSFLEYAARLCGLMIFTSISEERTSAIQKLLVAENAGLILFEDLTVIRPGWTLKPKSACGREDAFFLDGQEGVIVPGQEDWWTHILEYFLPGSSEDNAVADT